MVTVMEEQRKKPLSMQTVESLHHKVDKVVRLLSDVAENQKKNAKILHQLQKANEAQAQKEQEEIEKVFFLSAHDNNVCPFLVPLS